MLKWFQHTENTENCQRTKTACCSNWRNHYLHWPVINTGPGSQINCLVIYQICLSPRKQNLSPPHSDAVLPSAGNRYAPISTAAWSKPNSHSWITHCWQKHIKKNPIHYVKYVIYVKLANICACQNKNSICLSPINWFEQQCLHLINP